MTPSITNSLEPEELVDFKKYTSGSLLEIVEIPERAENRKLTDIFFLIAFATVILLLIPFLIYTLAYSDIRRYHGYDPCGNICGEKNAKDERWDCTGTDFTDKKYLQFEESLVNMTQREILLTPRECVSRCTLGYTETSWVCTPEAENVTDPAASSFKDVGQTVSVLGLILSKIAKTITLACFLSLAVSLGILYLFRIATAAIVWSILTGILVLLTAAVGGSWYKYSQTDSEAKSGSLFLSILLTIILLIVTCIMVFLYKKIQIVILLLKEAMKATFSMPQLFFVPVLVFIAKALILVSFTTTCVYMATSGYLTEIQKGYLSYEKNGVMVFSLTFNTIVTIWVIFFVGGIQQMVVAGTVSKWYFAKNKDQLGNPLLTSAGFTFKYHLGTVAVGSLVVTVASIIRSILSKLIKNRCFKCCMGCCMAAVEHFLKHLSSNAFIMSAMHGKPFFKSGKRAAQIIVRNALHSINFIGDFVLAMAVLMIAFVSLLLTYAIMQVEDIGFAPVVDIIVFVVAIVVGRTLLSIIQTVVDTIFLCFCEDNLMNDGVDRPYAMSRSLMELMDKLKKAFPDKK